MIPELLKESLQILALDPDNQMTYLRGLGTYPAINELLLEFDDAFDPIRESLDQIEWNPGVLDCVKQIDELLETIDDDDPDVTGEVQDLDLPVWDQIREQAKLALANDRAPKR